jgi:hypothetical protein
MFKSFFITVFALVIANSIFSQVSLTSSDQKTSLQIGGLFSAYYNLRLLKPGYDNYKHNEPGLKDMELDFWGKSSEKFVYELKVNFAELIADAASGGVTGNAFSPDDPGLKSGYVMYKGFPVHIKLGWDKLPYSQSSITDTYETPYWSRDLLTGGDMFSRRDMGLTLSSSFLDERINIYGGAYSGVGEYFIYNGDNDASGQPEYVGRIDFSYPEKYDYKAIDIAGATVPKFRIGANIRYTNKTQPGSNTLSSTILGDYDLNIVDGKKTVYGFDFSGEYKHFSVQLENQMIRLLPVSQSDKLFGGTAQSVNQNKVNAGGWVGAINYNWKNINSVFSVKYENVNLDDLIYGNEENLYVGYAYLIKGWHSCLKAEWVRPLKEDVNSDPLKYTNNFRIGLQIMFDNETFAR